MDSVKHIDNNLSEFIDLISDSKQFASVSFLVRGNWRKIKVKLQAVTETNIQLNLIPDKEQCQVLIETDQPVGITVASENCNYLAETVVVGVDSNVNENKPGLIVVKIPFTVEKMQRRAYVRVDVPGDMKIKVLFWHRGYSDDSAHIPVDNYWEGEMLDLSAGGLQMIVDNELAQNFSKDQFVGMQFTPMPYQRPVIVDGIIRHIICSDNGGIALGIKFIGLESSAQGREIIKRLSATIEEYKQQ